MQKMASGARRRTAWPSAPRNPRKPRREIATPHGRPSAKPTTHDSQQAASAEPTSNPHINNPPKEC